MSLKNIRRIAVDTSGEDNLMIGLIVNDDFCRRVLPMVKDDFLVVRQNRRIVQWITRYFEKYGKAPRQEIQPIYQAESKRMEANGQQAEADLVGDFLAALSDHYQKQEEGAETDWGHRADLAVEYLRKRSLELVAKGITKLTDRGDLDKAELLVQGYRPPIIAETDLPTVKDIRAVIGNIEWLWENWIPFGFLTLLVGDSEVGKSALALWLCGVVSSRSKRKTWPDGSRKGIERGSTCLWAETEGGLAIHEDRMKLFVLRDDSIRFFPKDLFQNLNLDDPQHIAALDACIEEYNPPLVVVDSLRGAHGGG